MTWLRRIWPWLAAVVSGFLYAASFPPFDQSWLCWFALTPLIAATWFSGAESKRRWLRNLFLGYVAGLVFFTAAFYWLGALARLFDNTFLVTLPFLLALYLALYPAVWSLIVGLLRPPEFVHSWRNLLIAFSAAAAWTALEWMRGWLFGGFGWNGLGIALHAQWLALQIAEFTGVAGITFVIAFANVIALTTPVRLYFEARQHKMRPHWDLNLTMLMIMGLLAFGWHALKQSRPGTPVRVATVQAAIPQREKMERQSVDQIFETYRRLSSLALRTNTSPDLLVWPESATPGPAFGDQQSYNFVMEFAAGSRTDLLLGTDEIEMDRAFNSAVLVSAGGRQTQVYRKIHLVPFGEYVPLRKSFPPFAAIAGRWVPGDFSVGEKYSVFHLSSGAKVAPLICFEDTIGDLDRQFVSRGADLLVNVTNDGWFQRTAGSRQHLANAIFRCIETRRPMARAANTGVTCFVNELGRVTQLLQDDTGSTFGEGVLTGTINVPQNGSMTFYVRHGELFAQVCGVITMLMLTSVAAQRWIGRSAGRC